MSVVLVTGGTGFLGSHLVSLLVRRGEEVRVLTRARPLELDAHDVDVVEGSLLDPETMATAVRGVDRIYHMAGLVSRDPASAPELYRVHVEGTRLLLQSARGAGVRRVVMASTSGIIAVTRDGEEIPNEDAPYRYETVKNWPYYLSKIYQEKLALSFAGPPEVVAINPSLILGPDDPKLSSTGDVLSFMKKELPVMPSGGMNFVDARDAAAGAILAMEQGTPGRRYLLGGPNWTMAEFFNRLSRITGIRAPSMRIPDWAARAGARLVDGAVRLADENKRSAMDPETVAISQHFWWLDATRARTELGWEPRDPMETLEDTVAWLRERHMGGAPRRERAPSLLETIVARPEQQPAAAAPRPRRRRSRG